MIHACKGLEQKVESQFESPLTRMHFINSIPSYKYKKGYKLLQIKLYLSPHQPGGRPGGEHPRRVHGLPEDGRVLRAVDVAHPQSVRHQHRLYTCCSRSVVRGCAVAGDLLGVPTRWEAFLYTCC